MNWANLQTQFGNLSLAFSIFLAFGLLTWWVIRKQQNRLWLPSLRILKMHKNKLPKMRLVRPPLISFLSFLIICLASLFFTLKPSQLEYQSIDPGIKKTHVFVDLSPSVFQSTSLGDYKQKLNSLLSDLLISDRLSVSLSIDGKVVDIDSSEQIAEILSKVEMHRPGLKIGSAIYKVLESVGELDQLIIFSDRDKFSWSDFNWQYLGSKFDIYSYSVVSGEKTSNIFIDSIEVISEPDELKHIWQVDVSRASLLSQSSYKLKLYEEDRLIKTLSSSFLDEQRSQKVIVEVNKSEISEFSEVVLRWQIDSLDSAEFIGDNIFYSRLNNFSRKVLLVSEPQGEMFLEDSIHHLKLALEVMGFTVKRLDRLPSKIDEQLLRYPLWILSAAQQQAVGEFCASSALSVAKSKPVVWLLPSSIAGGFENLCQCSAAFIEAKSYTSQFAYCEDSTSRDQYSNILRSLGAKQLGGRIDQFSEAIAWYWKKQEIDLKFLALTIPLYPSSVTGISYREFPSLVTSLIEWTGLGLNGSELKTWIEISDISKYWVNGKASDEWMMSNIPRGESLSLETETLPPSFQISSNENQKNASRQQEEYNARPWVEFIVYIMVIASGIEVIYLFFSYFFHSKNPQKATLIFLFTAFSNYFSDLNAQVRLNTLGYNLPENIEIVSREVSNRTSIELDKKPNNFSDISSELFSEGWIWIRDYRLAIDKSGVLDPRLRGWVKRGGFLIIENLDDVSKIDLGLQRLASNELWSSIPPDHEIMRSFHLLDALPHCGELGWYGYQYDDRLAVIAIPFSMLEFLLISDFVSDCKLDTDREQVLRAFVNVLMVALATDYKKDQIHLPEILKRLR